MELNKFINGQTKKLCLIGCPVEHTLSPFIHNTLSKELDINYSYSAFNIEKGFLSNAVDALRVLDFKGFNVTVPYKNSILEYLEEVDNFAKVIGAVNTVKNVEGRLIGYNTDGKGFLMDFEEKSGIKFKNKKVMILGAGGVARSICAIIASSGVGEITVCNRSVQNAEKLVGLIVENFISNINYCTYDSIEFENKFKSSDIIINTTSVGMKLDINNSPVKNTNLFSENQIVYDVIYNPYKTKLLKDAEEIGCKVINGLGMLIYQGVLAYEIWTDKKIEKNIVRKLHELCLF